MLTRPLLRDARQAGRVRSAPRRGRELARVLKRLPTQQAVCVCLWGAEENGLVGARHYVRQLDDAGLLRARHPGGQLQLARR
ncbi:M28 family peptidase [Actinomadura luteofluorescens]|uniref:M28 family peptidase n=1 Tax=Actinomadura luteofluorescens TaxID=46163 RepID=UPI003BAF0B07